MPISKGNLVTFHKRKKTEVDLALLLPQVKKASRFLRKEGFSNHILGIIGKNDLEWVIADLACLYCGIKLLPLEGDEGFLSHPPDNLILSAILISEECPEESKALKELGYRCFLLDELTAPFDHVGIDEEAYVYGDDEVLSFKCTSGSTGMPKVIGHSVKSVNNSIRAVQALFRHAEHDRILVFLPLSILQQRYWVYSAIIYGFTVIVVPKNYVFAAIKRDKPTVVMGVPYIYEIIHDEFKAMLHQDASFHQAYNTFMLYKKEDDVRFDLFNDYLGGHINYLWTGSAPISVEVLDFYFQMGIPIYQGYGMNETCIISKNYEGNNRSGSVGKLFPGISLRFDRDNQIMVKSEYPVCTAYTLSGGSGMTDTFLPDGYVATGDCGYMDTDGFLFINGRIKDIIVLSSSKKIFPRGIEERIERYPGIKCCIVFGESRPYLTALIVSSTGPVQTKEVQKIIDMFNRQVREEEKIYKFFIVPELFSNSGNLLSSQNKVKRQNVYEQYHVQFDSLYQ